MIKNIVEFCDQQLGSFLTRLLPRTGWLPAHLSFDGIECCNLFEHIGGEQRRPRLVQP